MTLKVENMGLTSQEAAARLRRFGYNEITSDGRVRFAAQLIKVLSDPMGVMLLGLSLLYWFLGDKADSVILLIAYVPVTAIDVVLELRSNKALEALKESLTPVTKVIRNGTVRDIKVREIVPGDVLVFEEGQILAADGKVIESKYLQMNEASLTGESVPVAKEDGDDFFGGTAVTMGRGLGLVERTGSQTKYGSIFNLVKEAPETKSPLAKAIDQIVRVVVGVAAFFAVVVFILQWASSHQLIPSLILALTFGMAAVPEEFPLVFVLYLSIGAWRLARKGVLVKSLPSVEALGAVDVICTDKTGTLTEGVFQLERLERHSLDVPLPVAWRTALMACEVHPTDSMETAIFSAGQDHMSSLEGWDLIYDYPFEANGRHMSHVWKERTSGQFQVAMKGAVEGVLEHCKTDTDEQKRILNAMDAFGSQGKRVLGLAWRAGECHGERSHDESGLNFLGFLVFSDPVRPSVKGAIEACQSTGIRVKILSGDHLLTAHAVADQIGLAHNHEKQFTGEMLARMSADQRAQAFIEGALFARISPEQKYEMVQVLKESGHVVAMTGDGINDAPAIRLSDIGISMGPSATDVARSAAKIVLMQNDFSGIVFAVSEGRRIFANLQRSFSYLISLHIPILLLTLIPPLVNWPSILLPVHIILLELIVHPISAFTFENIPNRSLPKRTQKSILNRVQLTRATLAGLFLSFASLAAFFYGLPLSQGRARALALSVLLMGNAYLAVTESYPAITRRLLVTVGSISALTFFLSTTSTVSGYLHTESLELIYLLIPFLLASVVALPRLFFTDIKRE